MAKLYSTDHNMQPLATMGNDQFDDLWPTETPRPQPPVAHGNAVGAAGGGGMPWGWIALGVAAIGTFAYWDQISEFAKSKRDGGSDDDYEEGTEYEDADDDDLDPDEYLDSLEARREGSRGSNKGSGWYVQMYSNDPTDEPYSKQKVKNVAGPFSSKSDASKKAAEENDVWYTRVAQYPNESAAWKRHKG